MSVKASSFVASAALAAFAASSASAAIELAVNGGFETGTYAGWTQFPTPGSQTITSVNPSSGNFAASIINTTTASNSLIKQANVGVGLVTPTELITIKFDARGSFSVGGVAFAEFFTELAGGGTSSSRILGGGPLAVNPNPDVWTSFTYQVQLTGQNVDGGVTLQLGSVTGGFDSPNSTLFLDNVSITVIPEPAAMGLLAPAGLLLVRRRR